MSAETFLREIRNRKRRELEALDAELTEKQESLLSDQDAKVQDLRERYTREAQLKSEREVTSVVEAAHLQAKRMIFKALEANLNSALDVIRQELGNYTKNPQYKKVLEEMIKISKTKLGEDIQVWCREEDRLILNEIGVTISNDTIQTQGGIIVENKEGTMELDFTFEELLRTHEEEIGAILLEEG